MATCMRTGIITTTNIALYLCELCELCELWERALPAINS